MAGRLSRSTLGSSSTSSSSSSGNGIFCPYEGCREEVVVVHDLNVEALPNWLLKNSLSDCVYQNDENSLRRSMTEIKTYEEVCTGKTVSCLQIDMNIGIILSFLSGSGQVPLRSSQGQSSRECLEDHSCGVHTHSVHTFKGFDLSHASLKPVLVILVDAVREGVLQEPVGRSLQLHVCTTITWSLRLSYGRKVPSPLVDDKDVLELPMVDLLNLPAMHPPLATVYGFIL